MSYWIIEIECAQDQAEHISWLWAQNLNTAVEIQDHDTHPDLFSENQGKVVARLTEAPDEEWLRVAKLSLIEAECEDVFLQTRYESDDSWQLGWKAFFKPTIISPTLGVRPPWEIANPELPLEIIIEPGLAFGVGTHATTQLAARLATTLLESEKTVKTVIDMGCGSGILAIAAAKWGHEVVAVEIDEIALENAIENGQLNHAQVEWICDGNYPEDRKFDVSIVNIIAPILIELASQVLTYTKEHIILSGMLVEQETAVLKFYLRDGWQITQRLENEGWVGIQLSKEKRESNA
jgi:ribosomal protein L11 methyltransferase